MYLVAGANGSGKTTLAHELLKDTPELSFLNADEIKKEVGGDVAGIYAGRILMAKCNEFLANKKSFVLESTISGNHHFHVLRRAIEANYEIVLIYVFLENVDLNVARVKKRVLLGGHDVSEDVIRRRFNKSVRNFDPTAKLADSWKLYYNGGDIYELIARSENSTIEVQNEKKYNVFNRVAKK